MNNMSRTTLVIIGIVIVIIILIVIFSEKPLEGEVKIGAILPLTGKIAQYSEEARRGIELALEDEKDVLIKVIYEDSKGDPKEGISAYQRLRAEGISLIITGASPVSFAISPLANQDKTLQMAVFSSISKYTSFNDFTFRVTTRSEVENKEIASWVMEQGYRKFALMYTNSDWGLSHREFIKSELERLGGEIIIEENFLTTDSDFRTQLTKIKAKTPEAIFLLARSQNAGMILKQAKELSLEKQFFGVRAVESQELLDIAKEAANGLIYPYSFNPISDDSRIKDFTRKYQEKYGILPTTYVAEGYDAISLIIKSIKQCRVVDTECIKNDLLNTKDHLGILGEMTFDENGDIYYPFFIKTVKNGQFVPLEDF